MHIGCGDDRGLNDNLRAQTSERPHEQLRKQTMDTSVGATIGALPPSGLVLFTRAPPSPEQGAATCSTCTQQHKQTWRNMTQSYSKHLPLRSPSPLSRRLLLQPFSWGTQGPHGPLLGSGSRCAACSCQCPWPFCRHLSGTGRLPPCPCPTERKPPAILRGPSSG